MFTLRIGKNDHIKRINLPNLFEKILDGGLEEQTGCLEIKSQNPA